MKIVFSNIKAHLMSVMALLEFTQYIQGIRLFKTKFMHLSNLK